MKADNILQTIGNTPHIRINKLFGNTHKVYIKSERSQPGRLHQGPHCFGDGGSCREKW